MHIHRLVCTQIFSRQTYAHFSGISVYIMLHMLKEVSLELHLLR